ADPRMWRAPHWPRRRVGPNRTAPARPPGSPGAALQPVLSSARRSQVNRVTSAAHRMSVARRPGEFKHEPEYSRRAWRPLRVTAGTRFSAVFGATAPLDRTRNGTRPPQAEGTTWVVYLWLIGVPVPVVCGRSADENPFAQTAA